MTAYGIAFAQTSNFGTCGYLTADWATYFTMDGDVNRGWIFRHSGVNRASINGNGIISANGLYSHGIGYDGNIIMPQGGQFYTHNQYYYGYLRITLPVSWSDTMFRFDVNIYGYESTGMATYTIGCYNYAAHPSYHSTYAYCVGTGEVSRQPVYYGYDNGRCTIYIGEGSTRWAYPQVSITNVVTGYSSYSYGNWAYGWSVDFTTYNPNASVVIPCNNVNSNTDNYGSTNPLDYPTSILGYGKPGAVYYKI